MIHLRPILNSLPQFICLRYNQTVKQHGLSDSWQNRYSWIIQIVHFKFAYYFIHLFVFYLSEKNNLRTETSCFWFYWCCSTLCLFICQLVLLLLWVVHLLFWILKCFLCIRVSTKHKCLTPFVYFQRFSLNYLICMVFLKHCLICLCLP